VLTLSLLAVRIKIEGLITWAHLKGQRKEGELHPLPLQGVYWALPPPLSNRQQYQFMWLGNKIR